MSTDSMNLCLHNLFFMRGMNSQLGVVTHSLQLKAYVGHSTVGYAGLEGFKF